MVLATLRRLNRRQGMTVVLVEHRLAAAMPFAHRLLIMDQGRVVAEGTPELLLQDRRLREVYGLRRPAATTRAPGGWRNLLTSHHADPQTAEPLLRLQDVTAGYGRERVLHDINLTIRSGEFAAIVGRNGAGKSTLARVIAGLLRPARGRVSFYGADRPRPGRPRPGQDVSLLFQNPLDQIFADSVDDELSFGPHNFGRFDAQFHDSLLLQADLYGLRRRCPTHLSVGQQQRCVLAACLALQPRLLILDEPTLGQDWAHLQQLMDFVQTLNERGIAILLISHDYKIVYRYARRVLLLDEGRIVLDGAPQVQGAPAHERGIV
jgi:energy-coupling factor transport system ATP-binding protein